MGGLVILGSISIGLMLTIGQRWFADNILMWFASPEASAVLWRYVIIFGLVAMALTREFFDNRVLKAVWASLGIGLLLAGGQLIVAHAEYIFDALLMLSAGISFVITALQPSDEESETGQQPALKPVLALGSILPQAGSLVRRVVPVRIEASAPRAVFVRLAGKLRPRDRFAQFRNLSEIKDDAHRLVLRNPLAH